MSAPAQLGGRIAALLTVALAAGLGELGAPSNEEDIAYVRPLNLVDGASTLQVLMDDRVVATADYGAGSGFSRVRADGKRLELRFVGRVGTGIDAGPRLPLSNLTAATPYTLIGFGSYAKPQLLLVEAWHQNEPVAEGHVALQFAHVAPRAPVLDIYVTTAEAEATLERYVARLSHGGVSIPLDLEVSGSTGQRVVVDLRDVRTGRALSTSAIDCQGGERTLFAIADAVGGDQSLRLTGVSSVLTPSLRSK